MGFEVSMQEYLSGWIVGIMVSAFGLIGLYVAAGARDLEMTIFGIALVAFAILFVIGLIRRHYDDVDASRATAKARAVNNG